MRFEGGRATAGRERERKKDGQGRKMRRERQSRSARKDRRGIAKTVSWLQ